MHGQGMLNRVVEGLESPGLHAADNAGVCHRLPGRKSVIVPVKAVDKKGLRPAGLRQAHRQRLGREGLPASVGRADAEEIEIPRRQTADHRRTGGNRRAVVEAVSVCRAEHLVSRCRVPEQIVPRIEGRGVPGDFHLSAAQISHPQVRGHLGWQHDRRAVLVGKIFDEALSNGASEDHAEARIPVIGAVGGAVVKQCFQQKARHIAQIRLAVLAVVPAVF